MDTSADVSVVDMTAQPFAYVTRQCAMADIGRTIGEAFPVLGAALAQAKTAPVGPPMARYSNVADGRVTIDLGFPVREAMLTSLRAAGLSTGATAGGKAMHAVHVGPYETVKTTYDAILAAFRAAGAAPADDMWERYLSGAEAAPAEQRTDVFWPLKPARASYE
ncbi:GyrI-like domain-containing protein [Terricaulis sp.]|uniref:GyrI-like domain-containing protein n=1 Tax=Terricaulis sp. TaxID=2768686 RepID=UPI0037830D4C